MSDTANEMMGEYWAGAGGDRWLANERLLERQMGAIGDRLLEVAALRPGERVIEIGCGTGLLAAQIAAAVAPGSLLAVDISEPLLAVARRDVPTVEFRHADAQTDALPAGHDLALSRFGVMFFADAGVAFANIRPRLQPGGRLCFVCWAPVADIPCWSGPLSIAVAHLGMPEPTPPETPGPLSLSDPTRVRGVLAAAGFADVEIRTETVPTRQDSLYDAVTLAITMGPAGALMKAKEADAEMVAAIRAEITRDWRQYEVAGGAAVPARVHFVTALNPG